MGDLSGQHTVLIYLHYHTRSHSIDLLTLTPPLDLLLTHPHTFSSFVPGHRRLVCLWRVHPGGAPPQIHPHLHGEGAARDDRHRQPEPGMLHRGNVV